MNTLRIRVVELKNLHGAGSDFPFALQVSGDSLSWWTVVRFKSEDEAIGQGRALEHFIRSNQTVKEARIIWNKAI